MMKPWLEGLMPPRRPHHENEDAAVVMLSTSCSEVVFCLGGLAAVKSYVNGIDPHVLNRIFLLYTRSQDPCTFTT